MPRPVKERIIESMPTCEGFLPLGYDKDKQYENVLMTLDEYETIRLIDYNGYTQEACAESMEISRPTVTNIYESARKKIADALLNEKVLLIEGGNYLIHSDNCAIGSLADIDSNTRIAVTYEDTFVFQHFGHCHKFKVYDIKNGEISSSEVLNATGYAHSTLVKFLQSNSINVLICGGIGDGAKQLLTKANIKFFPGVRGTADDAVKALIKGKLEYNSDLTCHNNN